MSNIWSYIVATDKGLAPCIEKKLLSICVCKPSIRRNAVKGDIIIGWASKLKIINQVEKLKSPHPLFIAEITDIQKFTEYFDVKDKDQLRNDKIYNKQLEHFCMNNPELKEFAHFNQEEQNKDLAGGNYKDKATLDKAKAKGLYQRCLLSDNFYFFGTKEPLQEKHNNLFKEFWETPLKSKLEQGHKKITNKDYDDYYERFLKFLKIMPNQGQEEIKHYADHKPLDKIHRDQLEKFHHII